VAVARKSADPTARLKIYLAAREIVRRDDVANAEEMAKILRMTWRNLRLIIDADPSFPVQSRGAEGIAWEFRVAKVLDHLSKRCRAEIEENATRSRRLAELAGVTVPEDGVGLSLSELREINRLQMDTQRRKIEQRELVPAAEVRSMMTEFFTMVQSVTLATVTELDPAGQWPAKTRADVSDHLRTMLVRVHDKFASYITDDIRDRRPARKRAGRTRQAGALRQGA